MLIGPASLALFPGPVLAQQTPEEQATSQSVEEANPPPVDIDQDSAPKSKKADILFAPVPFSSPSTGAGLAGGVIAFYNPNNSPQQWITGGGIVWTNRGTKGIAAFHSMSLNNDGIRIRGEVSYFDEITKFYGIGEADGDRGKVLELRTKSPRATVEGQFRVFPHGYAGLRFRFAGIDARPNDDEETSVTPPPPADQMDSTMSMIGPTFSYDTRDSSTQPHEGVNINAIWLFGRPTWGDSFEHDKFTFSGSFYLPAGEGTIFAMNGTLCGAAGDVPYYDLCQFGSHSALRGYPSGRYRDRASWSTQAEVRHQFAQRWGAVVFMGLGGIAPSLGDVVSDSNLLPAAGTGLRYRPFKDNDVNLRVDIAFGKNDTGVYLSVGEAF
jgi:hypothetical protein